MTYTYLFTMVDGGGSIPMQLSLVRRLVESGHTAHVLSDPIVEPEARAAGAVFHAFERAPHQNMRDRRFDRVRDYDPGTVIAKLRRIGDAIMFAPAEAYARDVSATIDHVGPQALVVDCMLYGGMIAAEHSGLPAAVLHHYPRHVPLRDAPPIGLGLAPARGAITRLRDRVLFALYQQLARTGLAPVNAARRAFGLSPLDRVFDQMERLDRELLLTTREFDFAPSALPERIRYVGPQLDDPSWTEPLSEPWQLDDPRPLVLVSLGTTYQAQAPLVQRVIDALAALPIRVVVTLGGQASPHDFRAPANTCVVRAAPHAQILPRAAAVVCHGGHGTVIKALAHGVPLVVLPLGRDQLDNAARVTTRGAGVRLRASASPRQLRSAVRRCLQDARLQASARNLQAAIARDVREDRGVRELVDLAGPRR